MEWLTHAFVHIVYCEAIGGFPSAAIAIAFYNKNNNYKFDHQKIDNYYSLFKHLIFIRVNTNVLTLAFLCLFIAFWFIRKTVVICRAFWIFGKNKKFCNQKLFAFIDLFWITNIKLTYHISEVELNLDTVLHSQCHLLLDSSCCQSS